MIKQHYTWDDIQQLLSFAATYLQKKEHFTDIIAISKGGLIPAQILAYRMGIQRIYSFGVSTYKEYQKDDTVKIYQDLPPFPNESNVLIVDDICDTGDTFNIIREYIRTRNTCIKYKTYSVFVKTPSIDKVDFSSQDVNKETNDDIWVVFPWDKE